jgi:hypothetical protein
MYILDEIGNNQIRIYRYNIDSNALSTVATVNATYNTGAIA